MTFRLKFVDWDTKHQNKQIIRLSLSHFEACWVPGSVAQSVMCLATDACLTADPGVASLIWARSHTFRGD